MSSSHKGWNSSNEKLNSKQNKKFHYLLFNPTQKRNLSKILWLNTGSLVFFWPWLLTKLAANLRVAHDNYFYGSFINFFNTI